MRRSIKENPVQTIGLCTIWGIINSYNSTFQSIIGGAEAVQLLNKYVKPHGAYWWPTYSWWPWLHWRRRLQFLDRLETYLIEELRNSKTEEK